MLALSHFYERIQKLNRNCSHFKLFFLFFPNGVIIVNALRKSLVLATSFAALGVYNSAMAEMVYKPVEQPVEAPNPNLKIEAVNEKFAEKYPSQFNSWKATEKGDKIIYADEQDPRLIVLWGGYAFAKEYTHLVAMFMR